MKITKEMLNDDQKAALKYIHAFLDGNERHMVLTGPAGTGKTALMNVLLDELDKVRGYNVVCTAPTNKAVDVIANSTGRDYNATIYSILGLTVIDDDDKEPRISHMGTSKFHKYDLIIIDEASMISTILMTEIDHEMIKHTHNKVIYVGDRCQIPPVSDANAGMMESIVFACPNIVNLTKVMRTSEQNPILGTVTKMRADMTSKVDLFEHTDAVGEDGGIWFYRNAEEFMPKMLEYFSREEYRESSDYALAVAYTNKAVDYLNTVIRKTVYPDADMDYIPGEELRVSRPYKMKINETRDAILLNNEERIIVEKCEPCEDPLYKIPSYHMTVTKVKPSKHASFDTNTVYVVRPDAMEEYYKRRAFLAKEAKERMVEEGHGGSRRYTKKQAWAKYNEFKDYYLSVGYVYALTAHKAQGTTIQNVFAIARNINRIKEDELRNKLKYTAFTRAAHELHVLD